jgi:DNA-directed RNA polymerase subunit alpha
LRSHLNQIGDTALAIPFEECFSGSIEEMAISSMKIMHVAHDFQSIPGVFEDAANLLLKRKKVFLKSSSREILQLKIDEEHEGKVLASDIASEVPIEIVNRSAHLSDE